jgi:hypothetical protein
MNSSNLTAIIPLKVDSKDRMRNIIASTEFLLKYYDCKIIIKEVDESQKINPPVNDRIKYVFEKTNTLDCFHRTKILNDMLFMVDTPYVVNYDCDMLIAQSCMAEVLSLLESGYDLVYPYEKGSVFLPLNVNEQHINKFLNDDNNLYLEHIIKKHLSTCQINGDGLDCFNKIGLGKIWTCGGMQFFNTQSYISGYGENEMFLDWGPEDQERLYRFYLLGYKVGWANSTLICHMDHQKTNTTQKTNKYNIQNHELWDKITSTITSKEDMKNYMNSLEYVKKRNFK